MSRRNNVKLPFLMGLLVVASIFFSFRGTQRSILQTASDSPTFNDPSNQMDESTTVMPRYGNTTLYTSTPVPSMSQAAAQNQTAPVAQKDQKSSPKPPPSNVPRNATSPDWVDNQIFSACLLIKDDNDILNEWIAYHYHVLNLRHLIVAVDPFSTTSPSELLDRWRQPPFGLEVDIWGDKNYMPNYFLKGEYGNTPSFLPAFIRENATASIWHKDVVSNASSPATFNFTHAQIEADLVLINNHRFRQVTFVSHCFRRLKEAGRNWVVHIDTDEYVVINPRLRARSKAVKELSMPARPDAGCLLQFLQEMFVHYPKRLLKSCVMMPTIMFGATENENATLVELVPPGWNRRKFETLRWTYHADWSDIANGMQKAIVDVATLPDHHPVFVDEMIKSVHQPLDSSYDNAKQICRRMTLKPKVDAVRLFPLTTNHYVGSLERYTARVDIRRNIQIYEEKARASGGVDDGWIQGWLASFVERYGVVASRQVLGNYHSSDLG